ncbi:restriction endonuclease subunit S [Ligilactobacillus salivarius]|uniref:Type I restriction-modification system, specificity subunit S n=1 Tax=Ligilactobacillus salivarius TaxID=1624 RepID=A0A089QE33_9LACO|nr:restriction endonuclease subunit S [Ligilactobacillus salivarius]AIR10995.1 Type I restriction-modification system, specificity subunit S [Ligilactobacillus salivarius]MDH4960454.1 restriction endonuclease subunit S [Ligilactobacillus salivarius]UUY23017.1 restriction endonuclease subunit S [Ligilactobacillus salivarius]
MVKMKDSGIEWIGEIPETWEKVKFNAIYSNRNTKVSDREYAPLSVTKKGIVPQLATAAKTNDNDNRKLVKSGDFVINSRSDRRGSCGISSLDGSVSLINTVLEPKNSQMEPLYFDFLFHTIQFADEFYKWGHGIVDDLWTTNWNDMKNITLILPTRSEQQQIANFLDRKTTEIDELIDKINTEIDTLKQYQSSVITQAVTKGLDLNVPMKDSGIEWIGEIPETWEKVKFNAIYSNRNTKVSDREYAPLSVTKKGIVPQLATAAKTNDNDNRKLVKSGDFVINSRSDRRGSCGISSLDGSVSLINTVLEPKNIQMEPLYFDFLFHTIQFADEFYKWGHGIVDDLWTTNWNDMKNITLILPTRSEQQQIAELTEYKNSLIFEYVTGKKQVKEAN